MTQSPLYYETCILAKQVKHISKGPATRAEILRKIIHTDLVGPVIPTWYDRLK